MSDLFGVFDMTIKADGYDRAYTDADVAMMERCVRLAEEAVQQRELPFAALVCKDGSVVVEAGNQVVRSSDVTRHAELVAISEAQKILGSAGLSGCTLYTIVEPCAMCAFALRETRISRVAFCIRSPMMGGLSKWDVLRDPELSHAMPEVFGPVPEVIAGLLRSEAENVWRRWNPVFWAIIQKRGYLGGGGTSEYLPSIPQRRSLLRRLFTLHKKR